MDGEDATVVSTGGDELRAIVPAGVAGKDRVDVRVGCNGDMADPFSVPVSYAAPGLFTASGTQAMAFNEDRSLNGTESAAARGTALTLYGTGFGDPSATPISVTIGGEAATVLSVAQVAGMPGVSQLKVLVPFNAPTGTATLELMSGLESAPTGTVVVQQ
jgi:uncharacterized protein (TIGR03437 family)